MSGATSTKDIAYPSCCRVLDIMVGNAEKDAHIEEKIASADPGLRSTRTEIGATPANNASKTGKNR
ncbi:hypothetical protein OSH39_20315 [Mycobacterium ulcerans]|nr:hypothetical protein [Mycobacterium ulcerans]BBA90406.1 hypothetical protein MPSD_51480 [Mycobacterium pseudoshottsii JCM 15466]GJO04068.1 hypothetical protein NJB18091_41420 [Mycobacterium marinum]MEB3910815.1 hypothetical protein [Mycobacterium ulcerans]MEB3979092.1 hypothetical protein [Mycobacterium ulcerans]